MNRRDFLKLFGYGAAVAAMPAVAVEAVKALDNTVQVAKAGFDPSETYGDFVVLTEDPRDISQALRDKIFAVIEGNMRKNIPSGYWDKVIYIESYPSGSSADPFDETYTIAWKYTP